MGPLTLFADVAATFAGSVLLGECALAEVGRGVRWIGVLVFWLCWLIVPVQLLAMPGVLGWGRPLEASDRLAVDAVILAGALLWQAWKGKPGGERRVEAGSGERLPGHVRAGIAIALSVYGILAARMAFTFPDAWDATVYHYPVAVRWLQEGTLRITSGTNWRAGLPGNAELLDLMVFGAGLERWVGMVQWPGLDRKSVV